MSAANAQIYIERERTGATIAGAEIGTFLLENPRLMACHRNAQKRPIRHAQSTFDIMHQLAGYAHLLPPPYADLAEYAPAGATFSIVAACPASQAPHAAEGNRLPKFLAALEAVAGDDRTAFVRKVLMGLLGILHLGNADFTSSTTGTIAVAIGEAGRHLTTAAMLWEMDPRALQRTLTHAVFGKEAQARPLHRVIVARDSFMVEVYKGIFEASLDFDFSLAHPPILPDLDMAEG